MILRRAEVVVLGAGAAGLSAALGLRGFEVHLLTKGRLGVAGASPVAQGGIAVALGRDDSPQRHAADTLAVAGGLADPQVVALLTREGPAAVQALVALGARFDRAGDGSFALGREAAHSQARILHARDATGSELTRALGQAVARSAHVKLFEQALAEDLLLDGGRVVGVRVRAADGRAGVHLARAVVLATGGVGQVYLRTTNPREATGDGLAMAARAGARLADLEFVQFHPTALAVGADPMPLVTEALRGHGAVVVDEHGRRFLLGQHAAAELAPRDLVARAIARRLLEGGRAFLDARGIPGLDLERAFPTVYELCRRHGLDPRHEPLPIAPAAHYHMGGVAVDLHGRASLPGLWACGEVASTGAHGANRLASNSLLEALVFGARVARDVAAALPSAPAPGLARWPAGPRLAPGTGAAAADVDAAVAELRRVMWERVGLLRDEQGLARALDEIERLTARVPAWASEARNLLLVGRLVARAALERRESRGSHFRSDHPQPEPAFARRLFSEGAPPATESRPALAVRRAAS